MSDVDLKLIARPRLEARLEVLTGLHIGTGKDTVEIGGIDNSVVKTPAGEPYVPGSSIKGKLRFLLEWAFGTLSGNGQPWGMDGNGSYAPDDPVLRIFGTPATAWRGGPTRLVVRDATLDPTWAGRVIDRGLLLTEVKTEVMIDRLAGKAHGRVGPRQTERVPAGAAFHFEAVFRLYGVDGDEGRRDRECLAWLLQGLDLLEQDALGGSGSRGYGRVRFDDLALVVPGGERRALDNVFRNHPLSTERPADAVLAAVEDALGRG